MSDFLPFSHPATGAEELAAVKAVLNSGWVATGPKNQQLEEAFCQLTGNKHAIAIRSATAGMYITLMALGIGAGDEVITPSMTWVSTLNTIVLLGVTPVMTDVDHDTPMVTPEQIEVAITPRTKAIVSIYYADTPVDPNAIYTIGERCGIPATEDAAHAVGILYKGRHIGARGTVIFSFHATKSITCAEGGLIVTDDSQLAQRLRSPKLHGLGVDVPDRQTYGWAPQAEVPVPGYKYNLTDTNVTIALVQLDKLEQLSSRQAQTAQHYQKALADTSFQPLSLPQWPHVHAWHLFTIRVDEMRCGLSRDALMEALKAKDIGTGLHFRAVHTQKYYRERFTTLSLPNTEWNSVHICSLPLFSDMTDADIQRVITVLHEIIGQ